MQFWWLSCEITAADWARHMSKDQQQSVTKGDYVSRINRVIDYIQRNLGRNLTLEELADVANFSKYHFHRIFGMMVGETLYRFIQRLRLEKAATLLVVNPKTSITEIALDCGFSGSATFARAFREAYGMSASRWRSGGHRTFRKDRKPVGKIHQTVRNLGKAFTISSEYYLDNQIMTQKLRITMNNKPTMKADVQVKELPEQTVAYVRHIGPYAGDTELFGRLFGRIFQWAGARGLLRFPETKVLAVYHDNPDLTDDDKLRTDVCITVPVDTKVDGEIGKTVLSGGQYAVGRFELASDEYPQAWAALTLGWLPESGFQPDDRPAFEVYLNDPKQHPEGKCIVEIHFPVKPL